MADAAETTTQDRGKGAPLPPYTAFASFKSSLLILKEHVIPNRIDRSVWGNKFSGSVTTQMLTAYRFMGLIDQDGIPQPNLRKLVKSLNGDEWPAALAEALHNAYGPIFSLDLEKATANEFAEKFRTTYGAEGETGRKCITFFLHAAKEAEIPVSAFLLAGAKPRSAGAGTRRKQRRRDSGGSSNGGAADSLTQHDNDKISDKALEYKLVDLMKDEDTGDEERAAIWTLIQFLTRRAKKNGGSE